MLKQTMFVSAVALLVALPAEAQERRESCAWNDIECIRRSQDSSTREQPRTQERRTTDVRRESDRESCRWNDVECIRRETERERAEERDRVERERIDLERERRDRDYDRGRNARGRGNGKMRNRDVRCISWDRRGECYRWERVDRGRGAYDRLPRMTSALALRNGRGIPADARYWVGSGPFRVELVNRDRDGVPERAVIRSTRTSEVQIWDDRNNDGWSDRITFYRNGRIVRVVD